MSYILLKNPRIRLVLGESRSEKQETFLVDLERTIFTCNPHNDRNTHFLRGIILPGNRITFDVRKCVLDASFRSSEFEVLICNLPKKTQEIIYSNINEDEMCRVWRRLVEPLLYRGESAFGYSDNSEYARALRDDCYKAYLNSTAPLMIYERSIQLPYRFVFPILVQPKAIIAHSCGNLCTTCGNLKVWHEDEYGCNSYEELVIAKLRKIAS